MKTRMVQYGVWPNCCNDCRFCLRAQRRPLDLAGQMKRLDRIKRNILTIDWANDFPYGISLLGGELYNIKDPALQDSFMELVNLIIERILKPSTAPGCRYSTVSNGLYSPEFLYRVCDRIAEGAGVDRIDMNFSYDLKYRFKTEKDRLLCLSNINGFHDRYGGYAAGVQMILTQYLIDMAFDGRFDMKKFEQEEVPGNILTFLYPHPVKTGFDLPDFFFRRGDFLKFVQMLRTTRPRTFTSLMHSTRNSGVFKYTGLRDCAREDALEPPRLSDGKQVLNPKCGHSVLYRCYSDSDACMMCDLIGFDESVFI